MFVWRSINVKLCCPSDQRVAISEAIHYELTGHAVGHYNPERHFQDRVRSGKATTVQSPSLDADPSKPKEQEQTRIDNWVNKQVQKQDDYVLLMEVDAGIPREEFEAIGEQLDVEKPGYTEAPDTFDTVDELASAIEKEQGAEFEEYNDRADNLREWIRNNPPFPEDGQSVVAEASRGEWLLKIVAPWILKNYGGLPFGVEEVGKSPNSQNICKECQKGQRNPVHAFGSDKFEHAFIAVKPNDAVIVNSPPHSIWIVGRGVFQLPYRRNGKVVTAFSNNWQKRSTFKSTRSGTPGQYTARAVQNISRKIFEYITGIYRGSQEHRDELINFVKNKLKIQPGHKLHDLVFGEYDSNIEIHPYPGAQQGEPFQLEDRKWYVNVVVGVTVKLGSANIVDRDPRGNKLPPEKQKYLLGYLASVAASPQNYKRLNVPSEALNEKELTDIYTLDTGLQGLARVYGASHPSGQITHHTFGTVKSIFEEIFSLDILQLAPGSGTCKNCSGYGRIRFRNEHDAQVGTKPTDYKQEYKPGSICPDCKGKGVRSVDPRFPDAIGVFKKVWIKDNGKIWFLFAKPENADPIYVDKELRNPQGYECKSCTARSTDGSKVWHEKGEQEYDAHYGGIFGLEGVGRPPQDQRTVLNPRAVARGEAPIYGFIPPQPETLPRKHTPTPGYEQSPIDRYDKMQKDLAASERLKEKNAGLDPDELGPEFKVCATCNGTGTTYKAVPRPDGTNDYHDETCAACKGEGQRRLRPPVDMTKRGRDKAAYLKASSLWEGVKNDVLTKYVKKILNLNKSGWTKRQKADLVIDMARYINARNAKIQHEELARSGVQDIPEDLRTTEIPYYSDKLDAKGNKVPNTRWSHWIDLDNAVGYYADQELGPESEV